jgi:tetratricopeptide (TPR) repeat protein
MHPVLVVASAVVMQVAVAGHEEASKLCVPLREDQPEANPFAVIDACEELINLGDQLTASERADAYIRLGQEKLSTALSDNDAQHERAMANFDEAIRLDPKKPLAYLGRARGRWYFIRTRLKADPGAQIKDMVNQQIADYSQAITLDPTLAKAYVGRGFTYMQHSDNSDAAIADFSKAIELEPDNTVAYDDRGDLYVKQKKYKEALADYRTLLKLLKGWANKDDDLIRIATTKILQTEPLAGSSAENSETPAPPAGGTAEKSGKQIGREEASKLCVPALEPQQKDDALAAIAACEELINLGDQLSAAARADAYIGRGMERYWMSSSEVEYKQALADFDEAIRLDPKRPLAYLGRGWSLAHLVNAQIDVRPGAQINAELGAQIENKVDQQIADYSQAISLDPTLAKAYLARGVAYMRQGNNSDAAIADFSKAIELAPDGAPLPPPPIGDRGRAGGRSATIRRERSRSAANSPPRRR